MSGRRIYHGHAPPKDAPPGARAADARERAIQWAADISQRTDVLYLDTETTGVGDDAEIIDIALVNRDGAVVFNSLVKPLGPIPPDSIAIHGIRDHMVADAPSWPDIVPTLRPLLEGQTCVVYNAAFDRRVIDGANARFDLPRFEVDWQCAMEQYAAFAGDWDARYQSYRWHKLERAVKDVGAMIAVDHRAIGDAQACRAVVLGMADAKAQLAPVYAGDDLPAVEAQSSLHEILPPVSQTRAIPWALILVALAALVLVVVIIIGVL